MSKWIRKGMKVVVTTGNDKGSVGEVLSKKGDRILVQGINVKKKSMKRSEANPKGGFAEIEKPIHISNVMAIIDDNPVKLRARVNEQGQKELFYLDEGQPKVFREAKKNV
jgi:large subunit ribosomal protein L24